MHFEESEEAWKPEKKKHNVPSMYGLVQNSAFCVPPYYYKQSSSAMWGTHKSVTTKADTLQPRIQFLSLKVKRPRDTRWTDCIENNPP